METDRTGVVGLQPIGWLPPRPIRGARRLISSRTRCLPESGVVVSLPRWNLRMHVPAAWRGIAKFAFVFPEDYEPELAYLKKILAPGKTFIDVGAPFGIHSFSPRGACDFLDQFGHRSFAIGPNGEPTRQKSPPVNRNVVAVHRTQEGRLDS